MRDHAMPSLALSAFDAHHPPSKEIIDTCVHCGFCLPVCPTYVLWNEEMDSPRGRICLIKLADDGKAAINPQWVSHFDSCLGCMACMTACPSGVDYGKLIEATARALCRRETVSPVHLQPIYAARPAPEAAIAAPRISEIRRAIAAARHRHPQALAEESSIDGSTFAATSGERIDRQRHAGARHKAPPRRLAPRMRSARVLAAGECGHGARARCRRL
jgi:ferredoxin